MKPGRGARGPLFLPIVFAVAAVLTLGWLTVSLVGDQMRKAHAAETARTRFAALQPLIAARLRPNPVELGAVWATHSGRICGLVNGQNAFGGKVGMTPFFSDGGVVRFSQETDPAVFGQAWVECGGDMWIEIVRGSTQQGFCATREGAQRCHWTTERRPNA